MAESAAAASVADEGEEVREPAFLGAQLGLLEAEGLWHVGAELLDLPFYLLEDLGDLLGVGDPVAVLIKNFGCDFVVHVALNRGYSFRRRGQEGGFQPPEFWVFPVEAVQGAQSASSSWGKVFVRHIPDHEQYREAWTLIRGFLELD